MIEFIKPEDLKSKSVISILSETYDWGLTSSSVDLAWAFTKGEGVTIAIIDTGISDHIDLKDNLIEAFDFTGTDSIDSLGHGCTHEDSLVWTNKYGITTIKEVYENVNHDTIIGNKNSTNIKIIKSSNITTLSINDQGETVPFKINAVHKIDYEGEVYKIKTRQDEIIVTPWHPLYVMTSRRGKEKTIIKKEASDLSIGDSLIVSGISKINKQYLEFKYMQTFECKYCGHIVYRGTGQRLQCRKCNKKNWKEFKLKYITLDEKLAFWLGLVITDGHVMKSQSTVEFCGNNLNLIKIFNDLSFEIFGLQAHAYKTKDNCHRVRVSSVFVKKLLENYLGIPSGNKSRTVYFPRAIMQSHPDVIGAFIAGCIEGDGNINEGRIRLITGSKQFAYTLKSVLRQHGARASVSEQKNSGFQRKDKVITNSYIIRISPVEFITKHLKIKKTLNNYMPRITESIVSIEKEYFDGFLYDFTIKDNKKYIANSILISNTHCAGIISASANEIGIIGIAPKSKIYSMKVFATSGGSSYEWITAAINKAIELNVDIINMSLGAQEAPPDILYDAIKLAHSKGIIIIAAAGNDSGDVDWPARYDEVIAVAAVNKDHTLAKFSSRGAQVDTAAPGVDIYSTYLNNNYSLMSGTSMATPFITGIVALLLAYYKATNKLEYKNTFKMIELLHNLGNGGDDIITDGNYTYTIPDFANYKPWLNND